MGLHWAVFMFSFSLQSSAEDKVLSMFPHGSRGLLYKPCRHGTRTKIQVHVSTWILGLAVQSPAKSVLAQIACPCHSMDLEVR